MCVHIPSIAQTCFGRELKSEKAKYNLFGINGLRDSLMLLACSNHKEVSKTD